MVGHRVGQVWLTLLILIKVSDLDEPKHQHLPSQGPSKSSLWTGGQPYCHVLSFMPPHSSQWVSWSKKGGEEKEGMEGGNIHPW